MKTPNYHDGSIVNLMSSISQAYGYKTPYNNLKILPSEELKSFKNIVLIVIDGLGYNYLLKKGKENILNKYIIGSMDSVFLPTTACAIPTFLTGVAPQQHACTGWFMHLKEVGAVSKILRFSARVGGDSYSNYGVHIKDILDCSDLTSKLKVKSFIIGSKEINKSDFNGFISKKVRKLKHNSIDGFFNSIKKAIQLKGKRKYIYAYWNELDSLNHLYGVGNKKAEKHFSLIERKFKKFITELKGTNTTVIVTADHGFVNTPESRKIKLKNHPKLAECLVLPLCGEARTAYCYVRPDKTRQFEDYVKTHLEKYCWLYKSKELVDMNFFGLYKPNPKLYDRIGDYTIICKENYIIKDTINEIERKKHHVGHHGGVSDDEMLVPLVVVKV